MTSTNEDLNQWLIHDEPTHFREWGTSLIHPIPVTRRSLNASYTIGAADGCWLQLHDPTGYVSRLHARLERDDAGCLVVRDLSSKNGITGDGARQSRVPLVPGVELGIGGITLIVESSLLCMLRELMARWIGWDDERRLNLAMRSVRIGATRRESLRLCGEDEPSLLSVARSLHLRTFGPERPFVVCSRRPRRKDSASYECGRKALFAANGGTLCIGPKPPDDLAQVIEAHQEPSTRVQLIICSQISQHDSIVLPPLAERPHELDRIIDAYAIDAGASPLAPLAAEDRAAIRRHESGTLADIEVATRRYVMNTIHGPTHAAELLGLTHSALSEWFARRILDTAISPRHRRPGRAST